MKGNLDLGKVTLLFTHTHTHTQTGLRQEFLLSLASIDTEKCVIFVDSYTWDQQWILKNIEVCVAQGTDVKTMKSENVVASFSYNFIITFNFVIVLLQIVIDFLLFCLFVGLWWFPLILLMVMMCYVCACIDCWV